MEYYEDTEGDTCAKRQKAGNSDGSDKGHDPKVRGPSGKYREKE